MSTALVRLHKHFHGKGPVPAKSFLIDSTGVCLLEGGFTVVKRTLIDIGRGDAVRELRREFQAAMREQFTSVVEARCGRARPGVPRRGGRRRSTRPQPGGRAGVRVNVSTVVRVCRSVWLECERTVRPVARSTPARRAGDSVV